MKKNNTSTPAGAPLSGETLPTWDLKAIYADETLWQQDFDKIRPLTEKFAAFKGRLGDSPETLRDAVNASLDLNRLVEKVYVYAHLVLDQETCVDASRSRYEKVNAQDQGRFGVFLEKSKAFGEGVFVPAVEMFQMAHFALFIAEAQVGETDSFFAHIDERCVADDLPLFAFAFDGPVKEFDLFGDVGSDIAVM